MLLFLVVLMDIAIVNLFGFLVDILMATVLSCLESVFAPNNAHGKSSNGKRMEIFIAKKTDARLVEKQSAK